MVTTNAASDGPRGRRLNPDERRQEILEAARRLFAERSYRSVSTAEVAEAAGVARSLVHHYFGGIRDVFLAVVADKALELSAVRTAGPETPFERRVAGNVTAALDTVAANRETWMAAAGHGGDPDDAEIAAITHLALEANIERNLTANADMLSDTPLTRYALRCWAAFSVQAIRSWLVDEVTREDAECLLTASFRAMVLDVIPRMQDRTAAA